MPALRIKGKTKGFFGDNEVMACWLENKGTCPLAAAAVMVDEREIIMTLYQFVGIVLGIFAIYAMLLGWLSNKQSRYEELMNSRVLSLEKEQSKIVLNYVQRFGILEKKLDMVKLEIIQAINNLATDVAVKDEKLNHLVEDYKKFHGGHHG